MDLFTQIFVFMVFLSFALQWWLNIRQINHVYQHREKPPEVFSSKISTEVHQKSADYTISKTRFSQIELIFGTLLLLAWTLGGGLELLDSFIRNLNYSELINGLLLIMLFSAVSSLLDIPFSVYKTFGIEEKFGFNKMTLKLFITDLIKQSLLSLVIGIPLIALILWLMETSGQYWWAYAWALWFGFSLLMMWVYPEYIAPLFNEFKELDDQSLKQRIEQLMTRCGFINKGILVMDGSKRSSHGNAYFTGIGDKKRIVFFDTLLNSLDEDEIEAVLAHELGHFKMNHIRKRMLIMAIMSLTGFAVLGYLMQQNWFYHGLGISQPSTYMALILFLLTASVFTFPFSPLTSLMSRRHEYQADDFAAKYASADKLVEALVKLYKENYSTLTPDPVYSQWYDSHPPASLRIANLEKNN